MHLLCIQRRMMSMMMKSTGGVVELNVFIFTEFELK